MSKKQGKIEYDAQTLVALEVSLSPARLNSYILMAAGNTNAAVLLHEQNTEISEGLFGVIQGLEITLRNAIHRTLEKGLGSSDWYDHIILKDSETDALKFAKKTLIEQGKTPSPPRIIAQLNFGFWVRLTSGDYEKPLWVPYLHQIFPAKTKRNKLNQRLNKIKGLRNKIAHHERILDRDLQKDYTQILEVIEWICPITSKWVKNCNRFEKRPMPTSNGSWQLFERFASDVSRIISWLWQNRP